MEFLPVASGDAMKIAAFGNTAFGGLSRKSSFSGMTTKALFGFGRPSLPEIVQAGDPVLHERAREVRREEIGSPAIEKTINDMVAVMRTAPGVGLAAPQIGVPLQIIVLEDAKEYMRYNTQEELELQERKPFNLLVLINPVLTKVGKETAAFFEGCLSVEKYRALVERALEVEVKALGRDGKPVHIKARGWQARILQHECDHLNGLLYVDRMVPRTFRSVENLHLPLAADCPRPGPCLHPVKRASA
ncbi:hypothetical protein CBR_g8594 [Chara braunii]|uniref:Peptide deformylase n=1 Tax=Chara braunii TaxID=69332 RepID=A0A388JS81_CHABU|nr:hypothetical protein CBR_g8594 [Chara braunii]|eukprot:GBG60572.1 hypothetical protein CBR_g8594 [Chara braunii]